MAAGLWLGLAVRPASAALIDGYSGSFALMPTATALNEASSGTLNPSFTYSNVPTYGSITIAYGPYFTGQSYSFDANSQPVPAQIGDMATGPLSLATSDPNLSAIIEDDNDPAVPRNPVIGGTAEGAYSFVGPIAVLFSVPVKAVELTIGDFAMPRQVTLEAFAADGTSLGTLQNGAAGYQQFDLTSDSGLISGLSVRSADGSSPTSAGVSGLGVYVGSDTVPVPAPGGMALAAAAAALAWSRWRRRSR